jgi:putative transposase
MRGYNCDEKIKVYGATNRVCSQAGGNRHSGRRSMPQDGHFGGDVFQLETKVFRARNSGTTTLEATRRRELAPQAGSCRLDARQTDAAGRFEKKVLRAKQRRQLVKKLIEEYRVSVRRACRICLTARSLYYFKPQGPRDDRAVRARIREIAETRVRYGIARIHVLLRREGWQDNHKRTRRVYLEEGLNLRHRRPRRSKAAAHRQTHSPLTVPNECWSMDFVMDALFDGRRFRALTVVDNYSRECLEIEVGQSLKGEDVVRVMERIKLTRGIVPRRIKVDNGSEFISKALDKWAYENGVTLDFSRPGKPTDNAFIESFNGSFRDECLNVNWFLSLDDAKEKITAFKEEYNHFRPHSSLGNLTPVEALSRHRRSSETLL